MKRYALSLMLIVAILNVGSWDSSEITEEDNTIFNSGLRGQFSTFQSDVDDVKPEDQEAKEKWTQLVAGTNIVYRFAKKDAPDSLENNQFISAFKDLSGTTTMERSYRYVFQGSLQDFDLHAAKSQQMAGGQELQQDVDEDVKQVCLQAAVKQQGLDAKILPKLKFVNVQKQIVNGTNWTVRVNVEGTNKFQWADLQENNSEIMPRTLRINLTNAQTQEFDGGRFRQEIITPMPKPELTLPISEDTIKGGWEHSAIEEEDKTHFDALRPQFKQVQEGISVEDMDAMEKQVQVVAGKNVVQRFSKKGDVDNLENNQFVDAFIDLQGQAHLNRAYRYVFSGGVLQDLDLLEDYDDKGLIGGFKKDTPNSSFFTPVVDQAKKQWGYSLDTFQVVDQWHQQVNGTNYVARFQWKNDFFWMNVYNSLDGKSDVTKFYTYAFEDGRYRLRDLPQRKNLRTATY